jgi:putative ABC transport system permease protein
MLVAFITILPAVLPTVIRWMSVWMSSLLGIEATLAAGQLTRRPTRTGLTVGLLVVVISNGLGLGNAVVNNVDDIHQWQRRSLSGDFLIQDPAADDPSQVARPEIGEELRAIPGVKSVVEIRMLTARASGAAAMCIVRDFPESAPLPWALSASEEQSVRAALKRGETVASGVLAKKLNAKIGDDIQLEVQGRQFTAKIAAIVNEYNLGGMVAFLDHDAVMKENAFDPGRTRMYVVRTTDETAREAARPKIEALTQQKSLTLIAFATLRARIDSVISKVVWALWGLLAVGFVVGGFGMGNTLTMSVLEQTRELGLLRIIGMTRGQVYKLVFCEALYFALAAGILGVIAGFTTAYVIHLVNGPLMGREIPFVFQPALAALNAALCFVVAIASTWIPGRRVARIDLLEAMAYE